MNTIKSSSDISRLFNSGKRISTPEVNLIYSRSEEQHDLDGRVAFIAGKKNGNAVWRNRAKRRMRGLCMTLGGPFPGYDVLFVARKNVNRASFETMEQNLKRALQKAGLNGTHRQ